MQKISVFAYIERDPDTGLYVGVVPNIKGAHTQAATLDELRTNMQEVLELCVEEGWLTPETAPHFTAVQQFDLAV